MFLCASALFCARHREENFKISFHDKDKFMATKRNKHNEVNVSIPIFLTWENDP